MNFQHYKIPMNKINVFKTTKEFLEFRSTLKDTVGFVPTMGALHTGHGYLLQQSARENQSTILSIFVNPTQFNSSQDFEKYPQTFDNDIILANKFGVTAVFYPSYDHLYPDKYNYKIIENEWTQILCGATRPGHFEGVMTVVMKLLNIIQPHNAYFGEKDYQQLMIIKQMAEAFFMKTEVVGVPTQRETSGLALSSRNSRLSDIGLKKASLIFQTLMNSKSAKEAQEILVLNGFTIDYLEDYKSRRFVAAFLEGVRLIDNVELK